MISAMARRSSVESWLTGVLLVPRARAPVSGDPNAGGARCQGSWTLVLLCVERPVVRQVGDWRAFLDEVAARGLVDVTRNPRAHRVVTAPEVVAVPLKDHREADDRCTDADFVARRI